MRAAQTAARITVTIGLGGPDGQQGESSRRRARQHGRLACERLSPQPGLRDRRADEPHDQIQEDTGRAEGLPAVRGLRRGVEGDQARCCFDQFLAEHPCRVRHEGDQCRRARVHGKAAGDQHRGCAGRGEAGEGKEQGAGAGLYPACAPELGEVHRAGQDAGQAAGDAPQPQPAEQRAGMGLAQESDR